MLEVERRQDDEELHNFKIIAVLEKDQGRFNFDLYSNLNVNAILRRCGYFPGLAIGWTAQGWTSFPLTQQEIFMLRLGCKPNSKEIAKTKWEEQAR